MRLLVSVRNALEASAALEGGADVIDAKEPSAGALGPVSLRTFDRIVAAAGSRRPVSAAMGDAGDERTVERNARAFSSAGAAFVKIGLAHVDSDAEAAGVIAAAVSGAGAARAGVVVVAYADHRDAAALPLDLVVALAARGGAQGVLLDTARKQGPSLRQLVSDERLAAWLSGGRSSGLFTAVAGRLTLEDMPGVAGAAPDLVGVRGAACVGGREGQVSVEKVRALRTALGATMRHTPPTADLAAACGRTLHRG